MDICQTLDTLIDRWCERRAIRPLQFLFRAYPGVLAHTDQKFELLSALKDVKGLYPLRFVRVEEFGPIFTGLTIAVCVLSTIGGILFVINRFLNADQRRTVLEAHTWEI